MKTRLEFAGTQIEFSATLPQPVQWIEEFFPGMTSSRPNETPAVGVHLVIDSQRYAIESARYADQPSAGCSLFTLDGSTHDQERIVNDTRFVVYDRHYDAILTVSRDDSTIDLLVAKDGTSARQLAMRCVREVMTSAALSRGWIPFHGAAVSVDQRTILVTGRKMAGKTSLLLYLLSQLRANYLTNDRAFGNVGEEGQCSLCGMPTLVSIRESSLDLFHSLRSTFESSRYSRELTIDEAVQRERSGEPPFSFPLLTPLQMAHLLDRPLEESSPLTTIAVPRVEAQCPHFDVSPIDTEEAVAELIENGLLVSAFPIVPTDLMRACGFAYEVTKPQIKSRMVDFISTVNVADLHYGKPSFQSAMLAEAILGI